MQNNNAYTSLITKLDQFIRKFYTNEVIRGVLFSAIYVLVLFQAINVMEYYLYLPTYLRKILFFGFIFSSIAFVVRFVAIPLLKYYRLGKTISHETASQIIGNHFQEVKDKLLNILQLKKLETLDEYSLVNASISQKIDELKPVSFTQAIDLKQNKKYVYYLLPPLVLFLGILVAAPNIIKQGTKRLYHNDTAFEPEAPFQFVLKNKNLKTLQYESIEISATTKGDVLPAEMFLEVAGNSYKMKQTEKNNFVYELSNVQKTSVFRFMANGFYSKEYKLEVVAKPVIKQFEIQADYPEYVGKPDETIENVGDLTVPAGTKLTWKVRTQSASAVRFVFDNTAVDALSKSDEHFVYSKTMLNAAPYTIKLLSAEIGDADSMTYSIAVVPDMYPQVNVTEKRDSLNDRYFYYLGDCSDDYGIKKLTFNYQISRADIDSPALAKSVTVNIASGTASAFQYFWNMAEIGMQPGDKMAYYFEVWDNDGVHGSKSTKSALMNFAMPTENQLQKEFDKENKEIKDDLKQSIKDAKDLKNKMQEMQNKLMEKKNLSWEDKKNIQDLLDKQKELEKQMQEMKEKFADNIQKQEDFKQQDESIREKQQQLQELFDKVMNDEMKKMYEKLEKMLDELQKKEAIQKMDDMKANNEKAEKELDRMLDLFKKLELQQKTQETIDKLEKMAEKQDQLAKQAEQKNADSKALEDKQKKLNEEMKQAQKDVQDIEKMTKETKQEDADTKETKEDMEKAEQDMNDAEQDLNQKQNQKASQNQKSASKNMKSAAKKLGKMKAAMEQQEQAEDMQAIRQLLKNILSLSFDQEKLMQQLKLVNVSNPKYVELMKEQQRIKDNSTMVEDSLYALAKRVFQIKSFVTKQMTDANRNLNTAIADMEERNTYKAAGHQQYVMTAYNNLALMLSETQQEMQQQSADSDPKDGPPKMCKSCKKPGNGKPNMSQMQKQLSDKISQLAEKMEKEGKEGKDGKGGKTGQAGQNGKENSREFAELAAQQAQLRKMLEKLNAEQNKDGKNSLGNLGKTIQQMEQTETELVNKRISNEMLRRQQEIMVRLLESEKAQKERGEKQERESNSGKELEKKVPPSLENYLKQQQSMVDLYKKVPPTLKPFYKQLSEKYFKTIAGQQ